MKKFEFITNVNFLFYLFTKKTFFHFSVPSLAPSNVECKALDSNSIQVRITLSLGRQHSTAGSMPAHDHEGQIFESQRQLMFH